MSSWKEMGFQGDNARTDLRTGLFALQNMVYLAERYPADFRAMSQELATRVGELPVRREDGEQG